MAKKVKKSDTYDSKISGLNIKASDFSIKAVTTGDIDVTNVTGTTQYNSSRDYTAYINTTVTEVSASINAVLSGETTPTGHSLSIVTELPIEIITSTVTNIAPTEVLETITTANSGYTASGTLSLVTPVSTYSSETLTVTVSTDYVLTDIGSGILSASQLPLSGTIASDGSWTLDFTNQEILTNGTIISGDYSLDYLYEQTATPIVIRHTVVDGADYNDVSTAALSAIVIDPADTTILSSSMFTLSTNSISDNNPWKDYGALPGETAQETRSRFIVEGII